MRARLEPTTWLIGAIAAWSVACAVIALSGFGGSYKLLPDDRSLIKSPVAIPVGATRSTMGPLESYAEAYNHPLFYPDRKPIAVHVTGPSAEKALDVTLTSVIRTPTLQMAIVEDPKTKDSYRVRQGQPIGGSYGGWKLSELTPRSATFEGGSQGKTTLDLRVFDGKGGEEPTRTGLTPQVVASGALGPPRTVVNVGDQDANQPNAPVAAPDTTAPPDAPVAPNDVAARAAAEAAQQAEQIRRRIEERRRQAQSQRDASNNKD